MDAATRRRRGRRCGRYLRLSRPCTGNLFSLFRVEKASGDTVTLRGYLEHVWAAVAKEALAMVFKGADATGFEADARLTAMWLWTLNAPTTNGNTEDGEEEDAEEDEVATKKLKLAGFKLEYDAARKIAQGLGAELENLSHLVEVSGDQARLLPVAERTRHLFGRNRKSGAPGSEESLGTAEYVCRAD